MNDDQSHNRNIKPSNIYGINDSASTLITEQNQHNPQSLLSEVSLEGSDQINESRRLPDKLIDFKKVKGMGMFAELNLDQKQSILTLNEDYSQGLIWASSLKNTPFLKRILRFLTQSIAIDLNGLTHRGKKTYTLESLGFVFLFVWIIVILTDIKLMMPALNSEVYKVATDYKHVPQESFLNPTIREFDEDTKLEIKI